jgi:iron complex transport system substrate-binding protein
MRIVSTLASGTEIVAELGLHDLLVGISHECDHPVELQDRPRVSRPRFDANGLSSREIDEAVRSAMAEHGSVYVVDGDLLERLRPDLILAQAMCEVCAVPTGGIEAVIAERQLETRVLSLDAHTIEEILTSIREVGRAAGVEERATDRIETIRRRLDAVRTAVTGAVRTRTLAIEWLDPPFAPGHWVPQMIDIAGGEDLIGDPGHASREVRWDELTGLDPDALIVMPCGYGLEAAKREADTHANRLLSLAPRAIETNQAFVVDASAYLNRSGPRFVKGVEILAGLLHPDRVGAPAPSAARSWRPPARGDSAAG